MSRKECHCVQTIKWISECTKGHMSLGAPKAFCPFKENTAGSFSLVYFVSTGNLIIPEWNFHTYHEISFS